MDDATKLIEDVISIKDRTTVLEHDMAQLRKEFGAHKGELVTLTAHVTTMGADINEVLNIARSVKVATQLLLFTKSAAIWISSVGGALIMIYAAMNFMMHGLRFVPIAGG